MSNWRPIETAPKEGRVLVFCPNGLLTIAERFETEGWYSGEYAGNFDEDLDPQPTHWMLLPEPPDA